MVGTGKESWRRREKLLGENQCLWACTKANIYNWNVFFLRAALSGLLRAFHCLGQVIPMTDVSLEFWILVIPTKHLPNGTQGLR